MPNEVEAKRGATVPIPVYLKTAADMPRPDDPEFYLLTRDGAFLCRNHPFFASDVPTRRPIRALEAHEARVVVRYPQVPAAMLETIVGFFWSIYQMHRSEAVVLLAWDSTEQRYHLIVPAQEASVWVSGGQRSPQDVRYKVPVLPPGQLLVGDVHSHGNMGSFASGMDAADERYRDGVHAIVGRIEEEPPSIRVELAIDGERFEMKALDLFEGYTARRADVPEEWVRQVKVKEESWRSWYFSSQRSWGEGKP
jgi:PRTRC genetic system protein A